MSQFYDSVVHGWQHVSLYLSCESMNITEKPYFPFESHSLVGNKTFAVLLTLYGYKQWWQFASFVGAMMSSCLKW